MNIKAWISAFRLRTLLLSFSLIIMGSTIAWCDGVFEIKIFILAMSTTLFLQILSNISNDYGDAYSGADYADRVGPQRAVQSGQITLQTMFRAIVVFSILALISGVLLLLLAYERLQLSGLIIMLSVGILSIVAAICYTVGSRPYGYRGFGDLSTFIFFGLVGVEGSYIVYSGTFSLEVLLPASSIGLLSVGVLNMNNMRDMQSDARANKRTLIVIQGLSWGRKYQICIITLAFILLLIYILQFGRIEQLLSMSSIPLFIKHLHIVATIDDNRKLDSQLKMVSVGTLLTTFLFVIGTIISEIR